MVATAGVVAVLILCTEILAAPVVPRATYTPPAFNLATSQDTAYLHRMCLRFFAF